MTVTLTWPVIFGSITALILLGSTLVTIGFFIGDSRYVKKAEGTALEKAIIQLTESVKGFTETKQGLERVHTRLDELSKMLNQLVGACGKGGC